MPYFMLMFFLVVLLFALVYFFISVLIMLGADKDNHIASFKHVTFCIGLSLVTIYLLNMIWGVGI